MAGSATDLPRLRADCTACEGLCCMAAAFDAGEDFAHDKPAGVPCVHLRADNRCAIHNRRAEAGFGGCIAYDCLGAGQRVVQDILPGLHWRDGPVPRQRVAAAFLALREVHRLLELLDTAAGLPLNDAQKAEREAHLARLNPKGGWPEEMLARLDPVSERARVTAFLSSLADLVRGREGGPAA